MPHYSLRTLVCLWLAIAGLLSTASLADDRGRLARAQEARLAADPGWLALLHWNRGGTSRDRGRSYVDDSAFFLSPNGNDDAAAELDASIAALLVDTPVSGDEDLRCRFVARYRWLADRLGIAPQNLQAGCPAYAAWRAGINPGRVTLVFPGSYLNSPSSMFGHTLLRIDPPVEETSTVWLSRAVSFGADVTGADGSLPYVWKGLAGGYRGRFQVEPYFAKIQTYGRMENRDLWEYPLDFTPRETGFLVDHLWEIRDTNFDYYFFDENCSYRLLELLEVARPSLDLTGAWRFSEVPVNTVRSVREAGAAAAPTLRPSAQRELRTRIATLPPDERAIALALSRDLAALDAPAFRALPPERQANVLATAYAQVVYRSRKVVGRNESRAKLGLELLRAMNALPSAPLPGAPQPDAPEEGHATHLWGIYGGAMGDASLAGMEWRGSYHDMLDPLAGFLRGAELTMLDADLRYVDGDRLRLQRLDVANVFSLSPRDAFFPSWSWRVRGGIERLAVKDEVRGMAGMEGGGGVAYDVGGPLLWAFAEARVEHSGAHDALLAIGVGPAAGLLWQSESLSLSLAGRAPVFSDGTRRTLVDAGAQWSFARQWGLRLSWRLQDTGEITPEEWHLAIRRAY